MVKYLRDDIYFCPDCLKFHDAITGVDVDVPYDDMPAEVALKIMTARMGVRKKPKNRKRK